ncbi:X-ray radiation resistance-associated protein 1 isoform X2 [Gadus morhua]|uniref:X-ray radiation resistance-associated protein 1 isoform X2 n=1 Tax=Gadus morhua TaxID=8049 RepID=UPI0011B57A71|nr:X-ray radiation resistance-associated protein 1 isoform X2 [Gadus morhua]
MPAKDLPQSAGHWFVAHREHMEQRNRNIRRTKNNRPDHSTGSDFATPAAGNTLDGSLLIRLRGVENPSDLCSIDISEQRLTSVKNEDFKEFDSIVYINASDNSLSIESFRSFGLLRELDLSLNGCCDMSFHPEDFPHLEVLDLSFNNVSEADIVCIGRLAGLKVLCLTGNRLHQLPANMASSNPPPTISGSSSEEKPPFGSLEVLSLDDNQLTSNVFHSLSSLTRLQHLNLQSNNISEVPFMLPDGDGAHTGSNQGHFWGILQPSVGAVESSLPLPQLQFLSLAHNKIAEEEALLSAALFPSLTELVIHNNPLTTQRTGDPPLLTYLLSVRRGVRVKRSDRAEVRKPSVMLPDRFKHKIRSEGRMAKRPWLTEQSHYSPQERERQGFPKDPSSFQAKEREKNDMGDGVTDRPDETKHPEESFFVTKEVKMQGEMAEGNNRNNTVRNLL